MLYSIIFVKSERNHKMKIKEKINLNYEGLIEHGPITIVAFGDSVTHGAVGAGEIFYDTVYHQLLKEKINAVRNYVPVNVINAGIGGITAKGSLDRIDSQVLCHNPDLVIVCFGLNDVNRDLDDYLDSLRVIFERCSAVCDVIFLTPNMLNTYVAPGTEEKYLEYAAITAKMQNEGKMDMYMEKAVALAKEMNIGVCDCYAKWKKMAETEDTTLLLANYINHPKREMHELFAQSLFEMIFDDDKNDADGESTMFKAK